MTTNGRIAALVLAGLAAAGGIFLQSTGSNGGGLFVLAALVVIGTLFERRYRGSKAAPHGRGLGQWQATGEREVDHETGTILDVWYDPVSGERRYVPTGEIPR